MTVPACFIVTVLPDTSAIDESLDANDTGKPELAVATNSIWELTTNSLPIKGANVIA